MVSLTTGASKSQKMDSPKSPKLDEPDNKSKGLPAAALLGVAFMMVGAFGYGATVWHCEMVAPLGNTALFWLGAWMVLVTRTEKPAFLVIEIVWMFFQVGYVLGSTAAVIYLDSYSKMMAVLCMSILMFHIQGIQVVLKHKADVDDSETHPEFEETKIDV